MLSTNYELSQNKGHDLYKAIQSRDEKTFLRILAGPTPIRLKDIKDFLQEKSTSPLILAVASPNIIKELLNKYNNKITSLDKINALNVAIQNNHEKAIPIILQKCKQDITSEDIIQSLLIAVRCKRMNILNTLLNEIYVLSLAAHQNNIVLHEAKNHLNYSKDKIEKESYQAIINRLMKIPSVALLENIEKKKKIDKIQKILFENPDKITTECLGFSLIKASEKNYPQAISLLLKQTHFQIKDFQKGFALMRAIEKGHFESLEALLSHDSIINVVTWYNHAPLHEAHLQFKKSTGKKRKIYQKIIDLLASVYEQIWDNIELDPLEIKNLKCEIIINKMKNFFITLPSENGQSYSIIDKLHGLDHRILKFIQQKINDSNIPNEIDQCDKIILNEDEINTYIDAFSIPDEHLNIFINEIKLYFQQTNIEKFHIDEFQPKKQSEFLHFEIKSYSDFIRLCSNNIIKIFPQKISDAIQIKLNTFEPSAKQITPYFENTLKKRGRTNSLDNYNNERPLKQARLT